MIYVVIAVGDHDDRDKVLLVTTDEAAARTLFNEDHSNRWLQTWVDGVMKSEV